jgi:hypothetical protein
MRYVVAHQKLQGVCVDLFSERMFGCPVIRVILLFVGKVHFRCFALGTFLAVGWCGLASASFGQNSVFDYSGEIDLVYAAGDAAFTLAGNVVESGGSLLFPQAVPPLRWQIYH